MKNYKITYKNGKTATMKAYSVELHDGKYYVCGKAYTGDNPEHYILTTNHIEKIEEVTA